MAVVTADNRRALQERRRKTGHKSGIEGIRAENVNDRIRIFYGDDYGIVTAIRRGTHENPDPVQLQRK